jgi:hypothetical protein
MPKCWFLLLRLWLRVDGCMVRLRETRLFCRWAPRSAQGSAAGFSSSQMLAAGGWRRQSPGVPATQLLCSTQHGMATLQCRQQPLQHVWTQGKHAQSAVGRESMFLHSIPDCAAGTTCPTGPPRSCVRSSTLRGRLASCALRVRAGPKNSPSAGAHSHRGACKRTGWTARAAPRGCQGFALCASNI